LYWHRGESYKICEKGGGSKAKVRYALEVSSSCKTAKPENGNGRYLFSDVSIDDLKAKFNNLTKAEIKGANTSRDKTKGFILINKVTREQPT
jgi:hypothetical protein